ncbi:MAG: T9SS type A sorting domain-containing protein [Candidatus Cloacimonetes bacterium]|nr:T9SS type A sorting domain-containing protein [Candidatus Cloacimonadota bacterium]MCF7813037.1 T9SS type A sorting domain-containing protein [Candidatus Cloacimonadota bacterium]MCF7867222.1 T9SS type A sorting domain-containing protein [Candidatus Cloacimonadota bacterium]MCF7882666.1 T9SS type A sorting domain-containing protein [Candidatus Cloacimonadota bacterium]
MKKAIVLLALVVLMGTLFADLMKEVPRNEETFHGVKAPKVYENNSRPVPDWEFYRDPVGILTNYYDYQPGSYNSIPIRIQPEAVGGGIYITFHARETAASTRREYYAYIDANGNLTNVATIGTDDIHEGYSGVDIDPETGDPIVAWHVNVETGSADLEVVCTYDMYHLGSPGLWKTPFVIIDDTMGPNAPADEFIWPYTHIGPSPVAGKRRVYVQANNSDDSPTGSPSENQLVAYADFDVNDFNMQSELDWSYFTIPQMDDWHMGNPEWMRPNGGMVVSDDGKVAFMGYVITDGETSTTPDRMYVFYNDNYGEGDFTFYEGQAEFDVDNPQNQDGTYVFVDPDTGQPHEIYFEPYLCNHQNIVFAENNNKLMFLGNMNMMLHPSSWYPDLPLMYPKMYTFDLTTEEFSFQDIYLEGADPNDNNPMVPWDLDEDGVVDQFDPDGYAMWVDGWPIYHFDNGVAFHENTYHMATNQDQGWLAAVWSEGLKSRLGNVPEPGYEDWAEYPEVAISVSGNDGQTWEETIIFNAKSDDTNYAPELDGMIPCYIYAGDEIEDLGDGYGMVHLFFLDDNSYGSSIQGHGENLGGTMTYAALKIFFGDNSGSNNNTVVPQIANVSQNYPNPFNPVTNIDYSLSQAGDVTIEVFNVKGQKVTTLVDEYKEAGHHEVVWNGKDANNRNVSSGVYFYKMKAGGRYTSTRKMILLK